MTVAQLAELFQADDTLDASHAARQITGVAALTDAGEGDVSLYVSEKHQHAFSATRAAVVLVKRGVKLPGALPAAARLTLANPDLAMASLLERFDRPEQVPPGIHSTATIDAAASLGDNPRIGPNVFVAAGARIGNNVTLHAGVVIGQGAVVGDDCELFANVVLRRRVQVGHRCTLHAGCVIGTDGFGYAWDPKTRSHAKIPHIGTVIIGNDVEIGSCSCVDRGKYAATVIGDGTKIDNLVQIGHNCKVGRGCLICGQSALAGTVTLGDFTVLGGQTCVRDNVVVGSGVRSGAMSGIAFDLPDREEVSGIPAMPHRQTMREQASLRRLPDLVVQVRKLRDELDALKASESQRNSDA